MCAVVPRPAKVVADEPVPDPALETVSQE
jgi:hypothetical protein